MPYAPLPAKMTNFSLFENSVFSRFVLTRNNKESQIEHNKPLTARQLRGYLPVLKDFNFWCYVGYYAIITFRINTTRGKN
jgi:hypothetical protein